MDKRSISSVLGLMLLLALPGYAQVEPSGSGMPDAARNRSYIALKTNFLYDAILVPNIGIEAKIWDNYTMYADIMYAGWDFPKHHFYWDLYGVQCGARKYFGAKSQERSFTGHHAGIYGQALAYDLQSGNIGQQTITLQIGMGIEYGYAIPIARNLNLDFEIGIGYLGGKYDEYDVHETHNTWRATIDRKWIGPTKASISLMWLIKPSIKSGKR